MRFGILQRYVMGEVFRAFSLALVTITAVFVLFMVMTEATRMGLAPSDIAKLVPYVVPGSLPYSIPVSLLFAVTVVYGRLAGDNEIIAVKTAGQSVWTVLWPAITLGLILGVTLMIASADAIPRSNAMAKLVIFRNMEDLFYKYLKKDLKFDNPRWPFQIIVRDVKDHVMIDATFKKRAQRIDPNDPRYKNLDPADEALYDMIIQASKATLKFDFEHKMAVVYLENATVSNRGTEASEGMFNDTQLEIPIPDGAELTTDRKIQERTNSEMIQIISEYRQLLQDERKKQSVIASLGIASGMIDRVHWPQFQRAFIDYSFWEMKIREFETEMHLRMAMAWGSLFFVLLGAPVGIRFAKRDFLSAFITCFVPIILVYYPLMLFGQNMGKEGMIHPFLALWSGNFLLLFLAVFLALPPVIKR